jgi:hypothetical protein
VSFADSVTVVVEVDAVIVHVKVRLAVSAPSDAVAATVYVPTVDGVPEITPVEALIERPPGRPVLV